MIWPDVPEIWALHERYGERWELAYPGLRIDYEILRIAEWVEANPKRAPKKNWHRFITTWLARNQAALERAEARETVARMQRRADASVGKYEGYR